MSHIIINKEKSKGKINPNIYGHFSEHLGRCIYGGLFVGENSEIPNIHGIRKDVVDALKSIKVPVLRWPGGCFADTYHWKDGIGPLENRKKIVNTNWGGVTEDNSFGTHEFLELCSLIGCQPYISGNVGSGTVEEMSSWVEYCNCNGISPMADERRKNGKDEAWFVKYWGIGNEAWGCGGNMRPEYYSDLCRRYATYLFNYGDDKICKIASGANNDDYNWTEVLMQNITNCVDALAIHYYTVPTNNWSEKGSATDFTKDEYYRTIERTFNMETIIDNHTRIIKKYDKENRIGLIVDEWGIWCDVEPGTNPGFLYQQNSVRDALIAAINLNIFNNNCDTVIMANIAQTVNVLQALVLTEGEKMLLTPTYHIFDMYKKHQGAKQLEAYAETAPISGYDIPDLNVSASVDDSGEIFVTVANISADKENNAEFIISDFADITVTGKMLCGAPTNCNTFDNPNLVGIKPIDDIAVSKDGFAVVLPPCSVSAFTVSAK